MGERRERGKEKGKEKEGEGGNNEKNETGKEGEVR